MLKRSKGLMSSDKRKTMEAAAVTRRLRQLEGSSNIEELGKKTLEQILDSIENKDHILEQIRSQDRGIPFEYQFGAICWWLGKCKHFQFIDTQPEFPYLSKIENVRYPDAFTIFNYNNIDFPCFIQIKSYNNMKLKLTPNYVSGLKKYPLLKDYPLLIAWKFREFWCLFDIDTFISEKGGINVKFEDAMRANLMGILCGDFTFSGFKEGIEWYLKFEPNEDIKLLKEEVEYEFTLREIFFFGPGLMEFDTLLLVLQPFLGMWESTRGDDKYIYEGEKVVESNPMYASQVLPFALQSQAIKNIRGVDWEDVLKNQKFGYTIEDVMKIIRFGQKHNLGFEHVIHFLPGITNPCIGSAV